MNGRSFGSQATPVSFLPSIFSRAASLSGGPSPEPMNFLPCLELQFSVFFLSSFLVVVVGLVRFGCGAVGSDGPRLDSNKC